MFNLDPNAMTNAEAVMTFSCWDYSLTIVQPVIVGSSYVNFIDQALCKIFDALPGNATDDASVIELKRADGEILICEDDESRSEDWLREMLVSAVLRAPTADGKGGA